MIRKTVTKYYIDSKEVSEGDFIKVDISKIKRNLTPIVLAENLLCEGVQRTYVYKLDKKLIEKLSDLHILEKVSTIVYEEVPSFLEYMNKALKIFAANVEIPDYVVFELCAKAIAIDIDKNYPSHISGSPRIYGINKLNGKIAAVPKEKIKNYNNFAAFRCEEDAELAVKILKPLLNRMYQ